MMKLSSKNVYLNISLILHMAKIKGPNDHFIFSGRISYLLVIRYSINDTYYQFSTINGIYLRKISNFEKKNYFLQFCFLD